MATEALVNLQEMADILRVHPETLRGYVRDGKVSAYKLPGEKESGELRFRPSEVLATLQKEIM